MKQAYKILCSFWALLISISLSAQSNNPFPYPGVSYVQVPCNQTGPSQSTSNFINDFIHSFNTTGGVINISNNNSGCCGLSNNYIYYGCQHHLAVNPGQTITCNMQSGIIFNQGFAIFIDWNLDNAFNNTTEKVAMTSNAPFPAGTWTTLTFVVPSAQPTGTYRMRVRCSYAIGGTGFGSTEQQVYGETEDYNLYVGMLPSGIVTATASSPSPTICAGQTLSLSVAHTSTSSPTFTWTGPASFSSNAASPMIANTSPTNSGNYTVVVSNGACPVVSTMQVLVVPYPQFTLTPPSYTVCQGGLVIATPISINGNSGNFNYSWSGPNNYSSTFSVTTIQTPTQPANQPNNVLQYTLTVSPTVQVCPATRVLSITVNNPATPTLNMPAPLCNIGTGVNLSAVPGGGTWTGNPGVSTGGFFNPALAPIGSSTLQYAVSIGTCVVSSIDTISVSKFRTAALSSSLGLKCVQDPAFNLKNIVIDTSGVWSGTNVNNNFFSMVSPSVLATGVYNLTYNTTSTPNPTVCPSSTVLSVAVFNPPTPVIDPINPVCNTFGTVALTATPPNGTWTGNSGVSGPGIQTPSLNTIGTNSVLYTAGIGTCNASSSRTFHVSQFRTAALTGTVGHLCVSSPPVDLMNIVQNNSGTWTGLSVNVNNYFVPAGLPTNTYALVYHTTSTPVASLCPDTKTVFAYVLNPANPLIEQVGPYCSKDAPVQMSVTPATGQWIPTSYLSSTGLLTPSLSPPGMTPIQYVIGTNTCNSKQTIFVSIEAFVPADIVHNIEDLCITSPGANLMPFTMSNLGTWSGPGVIGSYFSPMLTGAGSFTLTYETKSSPSGLCPDKSTMAVNVFSLAPPLITKIGPYCNTSQPVQLQVSPVGGLFGGSNTQAVTQSGVFNPAMGIIGDNIVSYSIMVGPCLAYAQTSISVEQFVSADFDKQLAPAYCRNHLPFNLNSMVKNPGGTWVGPGVVGSMFDPAKANLGSNNEIRYYTHSMPNATLCPDESSVWIKIKDIPKVSALSSTVGGCAPVSITFNSPENDNGFGSWNLGDGSETKNGFIVQHVFDKPGQYEVLYNYTDGEAEGCSTQVKIPYLIKILDVPTADFSAYPNEVFISDPQVQFTNHSSILGDNLYEWTIPGVNQFNEVNPNVTFPHIGNYKVTLQATNINGCKTNVTKTIEVKNDFSVYIPNSFTPNYDGLNDFFLPVFSAYGLDHKTFSMEIFDRWGHMVYQTKDHTKGWDGSLRNKGDVSMKEDSYNYRIRFKDLEGQVYERTGLVVLLH